MGKDKDTEQRKKKITLADALSGKGKLEQRLNLGNFEPFTSMPSNGQTQAILKLQSQVAEHERKIKELAARLNELMAKKD